MLYVLCYESIMFFGNFRKLSEEDASERFEEIDSDQNGTVTWGEYISETYGLESEYRVAADENFSEETVKKIICFYVRQLIFPIFIMYNFVS